MEIDIEGESEIGIKPLHAYIGQYFLKNDKINQNWRDVKKMGLLFPSEEWAKEFCKKINENKNYYEAAIEWEGDFVFILEEDDYLEEEARIYIDLYHGKCRGAYLMKPGEEKDVAFEYAGSYENWVLVMRKDLDPIQGLVAGDFSLVGDNAKVMRYPKAAAELVESATWIDADFLGDIE